MGEGGSMTKEPAWAAPLALQRRGLASGRARTNRQACLEHQPPLRVKPLDLAPPVAALQPVGGKEAALEGACQR